MEFSAGDIAVLIGGRILGDPDVKVHTLAKIQEGHKGAIAFLSNPKYESFLYETNSSVVIVNEDLVLRSQVSCTLILVKDAYSAFTALLEQYQQIQFAAKVGIESPCFVSEDVIVPNGVYVGAFAYISKGAKLAENVKIYPNAFIGEGASIGEGSTIGPGAKIMAGCIIGKSCVIQAGAVIGSDGFGFAPQPDGSYQSIPQIGIVVIGDHVDIGANTTIDRATMGQTLIENGSKIDNLVQVAHNVTVGSHTVIAAQAGIAGSTTIGSFSMIGGQAGVVGHLTLASKTKVQAQSGVVSDSSEGQSLQGSPAMNLRDFLRAQVVFKKLPQLESRIEKLEK
jgi:UDP-3-O-[3-hydroxymyristoyl] glucosamine N-acyltransferase